MAKELTPYQVKMQGLEGVMRRPAFMAALTANASRYVRPDKMAQMVITAATMNPDILDCTPASVMRSVLVAASVGLEIGPALGHAYLVPFKTDCQFIMGYRGAINLVSRSGKILNVSARAVYDCDEFDVQYGTEERIHHKPMLLKRPEGARLIATYAVALLANGSRAFHVSNLDEIESAKAKSKAKAGPWSDAVGYLGMARKTPVLRLAKYLPMDGDMANATLAEEAAERGVPQGAEFLQLTDDLDPPPTTAEAVRGKLDSIPRPGAEVAVSA